MSIFDQCTAMVKVELKMNGLYYVICKCFIWYIGGHMMTSWGIHKLYHHFLWARGAKK